MEEREFIELDDIKCMAENTYGILPKGASFVTKTYTLSYPSANNFSSLLDLGNPIYVTNAQISSDLENAENNVYLSVSANNKNDITAFNVGYDGDTNVGSLWKYVKVSGSSSSGAIITLTLTGYELDYGGQTPPQPKTETAVNVFRKTITSSYSKSFIVNSSVVLSTSCLVFRNGILLKTSDYELNMGESTTTIGSIRINDDIIKIYDDYVIVY